MSSNYLLILLFCSMNGLTFERHLEFVKFKCVDQTDVSVKIYGAFRLYDIFGVMAELKTGSNQLFANKKPMYRSIFTFQYSGVRPLDSDDKLRYPYHDFQQFDEEIFGGMDQTSPLPGEDTQTTETKNFNLMTAFDTPDIDVFDNQLVPSIVYINDTNGVTAYQIKVEWMELGRLTIKKKNEKLVLDHPEKHRYEDNSRELNLAHLFIHFPLPDVYIDAILIVEKPGAMNLQQNFREYIALVYTRMNEPNGKVLNFRHRLITGYRTKDSAIIWNFDPNHDFCDQLDIGSRTIQGVVFLNRLHPNLKTKDESLQVSKSDEIYFMEITIEEHRFIRMFYNITTGRLDISRASLNPDYAADQWIPNRLFYNCSTDPFIWTYKRMPCPSQEPQYLYDELPGVDNEAQNESQNNNWFSTTDYFLLFASIIVVIIIVVVLAFGVYLMTTRPK